MMPQAAMSQAGGWQEDGAQQEQPPRAGNIPWHRGALQLRAGCRSQSQGPHHPRGPRKAPALRIPACLQLQSDHRWLPTGWGHATPLGCPQTT